MTLTDYLIDFALIGVVLLQIRDRPQTSRSLLRPVIIVAVACLYYLKAFPTGGHDLELDLVLVVAGAVLGTICAWTTRVWRASDGLVHTKAGVVAAVFWVLGVGCRLAFSEYTSHGGASAVARFSATQHITSENAWVTALVLMALAEVAARLGVLWLRGSKTPTTAPVAVEAISVAA